MAHCGYVGVLLLPRVDPQPLGAARPRGAQHVLAATDSRCAPTVARLSADQAWQSSAVPTARETADGRRGTSEHPAAGPRSTLVGFVARRRPSLVTGVGDQERPVHAAVRAQRHIRHLPRPILLGWFASPPRHAMPIAKLNWIDPSSEDSAAACRLHLLPRVAAAHCSQISVGGARQCRLALVGRQH